MAYINVDEVYILDNTGLQVDMATDIPFVDAGFTDAQKAQARKNIAAGGTNPNLVDNPWFTVRQRGAGPFSANGFTADRWQIGGGPPTVTLESPYGVSISATNGYNLLQNLPYTVAEYGGKTMTLSAIVDGELYAVTFVYTAGQVPYVTFNDNKDLIRYDCTNAQVRITHNIAATTHNFTVTAVKLEVGSVSTLLNDTPPDYGTELRKCQRYFVRLKGTNYWVLNGFAAATNYADFSMPLGLHQFAKAPTITASGTHTIRNGTTNYTVSSMAAQVNADNIVTGIRMTVSSSTMTAYTLAVYGSDVNSYIDLSADL